MDRFLDLFWPDGPGHNFETSGITLPLQGHICQIRIKLGILIISRFRDEAALGDASMQHAACMQ